MRLRQCQRPGKTHAERNSGTPYRQLLEEGLLRPHRFFELGSQPFCNAQAHADYLKEKRVRVMPLAALRALYRADTVTAPGAADLSERERRISFLRTGRARDLLRFLGSSEYARALGAADTDA